jgi:DME family drug/metabolite transporter
MMAFLPAGLALTAAFMFAMAVQMQSIGLARVDTRSGTLTSLVSGCIFFWLLTPFYLQTWYWWHGAILIFAATGLIRPFISANLAMAGLKYLGPTLSSTLTGTSPLFGAFLGVVWLGETMTWQVFVATCAIVVGIIILARGRGDGGADGGAINWPFWALALPIGASLIRSLGHAMTKVGMADIPSPLFAAMVGMTVSTVLALATQRIGRKEQLPPWRWRHHRWFVFAGLFNGIALICLNNGLLYGEIIVVIPIVATSPVMTLFLSRYVFRQESLSPRKLLVVALVIPAILLLALSKV